MPNTHSCLLPVEDGKQSSPEGPEKPGFSSFEISQARVNFSLKKQGLQGDKVFKGVMLAVASESVASWLSHTDPLTS